MIVKMIIAIAISVIEIAIAVICAKKSDAIELTIKSKKQDIYGSVAFLLSGGLNFFLLKQDGYTWIMLINFIVVYTTLLASSVVDLFIHKIPNFVLIIGGALRLVILVLTFFFFRDRFVDTLIMSAIGLVASLLVMLFISIISKHGLGYGDVKLYSFLGFCLGVMDTYYILFYAVFAAALYSAYLLLFKKKDKKHKMPFGPFTYLGFVLVYLFSFITG